MWRGRILRNTLGKNHEIGKREINFIIKNDMAKLFVLTGLSTSGKTSICKMLKEKKKGLVVLEVDDESVPDVGRNYWEKYRTEIMVDQAMNEIKAGKDTILTGLIMPYTIEIAESFNRKIEVVYILLDSPLKDVKARLKERLSKSGEDISLTKIMAASRKKRELFLNQFATRKNSHVVKTGGKSLNDLYVEVEVILEA